MNNLCQTELEIIFFATSDLIEEQQTINISQATCWRVPIHRTFPRGGKSSKRQWRATANLINNLFVCLWRPRCGQGKQSFFAYVNCQKERATQQKKLQSSVSQMSEAHMPKFRPLRNNFFFSPKSSLSMVLHSPLQLQSTCIIFLIN